ncbi:MAG: 3-(methylthio)propionyl-CoA ligase [Alphaproteobacteria bacterium]|nr:3-(methylthio)propionyl-CoA ligase [Alphaproteobacteria bacterium]
MRGLMMDTPLLISSLIDYAEMYHGDAEIVSRTIEGPIHRYTYRDAHGRAKQVANALTRLGIKLGDRVGTVAWNGYRHFELYYGVSGMGAVLHTINPRLFPEQIAYIVNHAEDQYLFIDLTFVPLLEAVADKLETVKGFVIMTDEAHMPETKLANPICYEALIGAESADFAWPIFDENTASSLCYTSGTTGNPKGVLYAHRSTVLHTFAVCMRDTIGLSSADSALIIVPMFHANAWGTVYGAAMCGAKLVFPGARLDGASVYELLEAERVTFSGAVPTVWMMLLQHLKETGNRLDHLDRVVIGGSAVPRSMIEVLETEHDVRVVQGWGMTEMSPLGTVGTMKPKFAALPFEQRLDYQIKAGRGIFGVEMKIIDEEGNELPRDGEAFGRLMVRGPWISSAYFKAEGGDILDEDGWFDTGDISTLDPEGYMAITDRAKDVIKSGGEWISSIDVENVAVGCAGVAEAAVIAVAHPKWQERPLMIVTREEGSAVGRDEILAYLDGKIAKWWIPDDVVFMDEMPHTATGKLHKLKLRETYKDYVLPSVEAAAAGE